VTGDRTEFLGRNGSMRQPAAMARSRLSGKVGPALDPCGAIQVAFDLADGAERELSFRLGIGQDAEDAATLINRFRGSASRSDAFQALCQYWNHTLGAVNVQTPDQSLNMLANGWLLYQTIFAQTAVARRLPAVSRGRRAALVAPAVRARRAHALLR
jgi:cellobiose phosphorylase